MLSEVIKEIQKIDGFNLSVAFNDYLEVYAKEHVREPDGAYHASTFCSDWFCNRKAVIEDCMNKHGVEIPTQVKGKLQMIFNIGHALHDYYRDTYLGPMGILSGTWLCQSCHGLWEGLLDGSEECGCCGELVPDWHYIEKEIRIDEPFIIGHTDGTLICDGVTYLLDIKTIKPDKFLELKDAAQGYKDQLTVYMHAEGIDLAIIFYICKSTGRVKHYHHIYRKSDYEKIIQERIYDVEDMIKAKKLPRMFKKCGSQSYMRLGCNVRQYCEGCRTYKVMEGKVNAAKLQ